MNEQGNILIIDDKKSDAEEFERVLEEEGYEVEIEPTAEAGLARAKRESFDVVLTGLHLSGSDEGPKKGLDIISELQAAKPFLAVILMTAKPTTQTTIEAMKLGAVDFVEKPIDPRKVQLLCDEILQRRATMTNDTVDELLQLAELALEQRAFVEARVYLKMAMLRDGNRAEPYYWLSELYETQGDIREALHYYCRALDAGPTFQPSRKTLGRLKQLATGTRG